MWTAGRSSWIIATLSLIDDANFTRVSSKMAQGVSQHAAVPDRQPKTTAAFALQEIRRLVRILAIVNYWSLLCYVDHPISVRVKHKRNMYVQTGIRLDGVNGDRSTPMPACQPVQLYLSPSTRDSRVCLFCLVMATYKKFIYVFVRMNCRLNADQTILHGGGDGPRNDYAKARQLSGSYADEWDSCLIRIYVELLVFVEKTVNDQHFVVELIKEEQSREFVGTLSRTDIDAHLYKNTIVD